MVFPETDLDVSKRGQSRVARLGQFVVVVSMPAFPCKWTGRITKGKINPSNELDGDEAGAVVAV